MVVLSTGQVKSWNVQNINSPNYYTQNYIPSLLIGYIAEIHFPKSGTLFLSQISHSTTTKFKIMQKIVLHPCKCVLGGLFTNLQCIFK